ncbi:MAG TPA: PqqD family protein [Actinomycetota bacterium]
MIDGSTVVRRNPSVQYKDLDDEGGGVLLHLGTGAYHGLNEVGALVWSLIETGDGISFSAVLDELRERLEEVPDDLADDISSFLEDLASRDLVTLDGGAA